MPNYCHYGIRVYCGKFSYFDDDQRQGLNKLVLNIALPAALFVSIIKSTRAMLARDATLTAISFIGVIVMFIGELIICCPVAVPPQHSGGGRLCSDRRISDDWFLGFAVLDPIYGNTVSTNLVIAIIPSWSMW